MKKIAVIFAEGFEEVEAVTPVDFLRRAGVEVMTVGLTGKVIKGSNGIAVETDCLLSEVPTDIDGVVLPGGMPGSRNISDSAEARTLIQACYDAGKMTAAICAAPALVFGEMGLLKGRNFTGYPGTEISVKDGTYLSDRVVKDGHIITSRGPGSAAEFALGLIAYLISPEKAEEIRQGTLQPV